MPASSFGRADLWCRRWWWWCRWWWCCALRLDVLLLLLLLCASSDPSTATFALLALGSSSPAPAEAGDTSSSWFTDSIGASRSGEVALRTSGTSDGGNSSSDGPSLTVRADSADCGPRSKSSCRTAISCTFSAADRWLTAYIAVLSALDVGAPGSPGGPALATTRSRSSLVASGSSDRTLCTTSRKTLADPDRRRTCSRC
mmetsp:Transcript_7432/g.23764  ORF Transcript_7432/g.23764 Transcript_7432/m.23764 type:complete len:200 (+) Transcript_7432:313-912(+)